MRGHRTIADAVVDAFGQKIMSPTNADHFTVNVFVEVSPTFFAWLFNFGDRIEVVNPPKVREEMKQYIKSVLANYEK